MANKRCFPFWMEICFKQVPYNSDVSNLVDAVHAALYVEDQLDVVNHRSFKDSGLRLPQSYGGV